MGVKFGLSHYGKDIDWECLRRGDQKICTYHGGRQEAGEDCTRSFVTNMFHQILLRWSNQGGWDVQGM
jgi:hypothetical protein